MITTKQKWTLVLLVFTFLGITTCFATPKSVNNPGFHKVNSNITFNDYKGTYLRTALSHDGKLLSIFDMLDKKKRIGRLRIYDTKFGLLKHETRMGEENNLDAYINIQFFPNSRSLFIDGFHGVRQFIWHFTKRKELTRGCPGFMLGFIEDISIDNQVVLYFTYDSHYVLCNVHNDEKKETIIGLIGSKGLVWLANYGKGNSKEKNILNSNNYQVVLANKRMVILHGFGLENDKISFEKSSQLGSNIDLWDINFFSKSPKIYTYNDKLRKRFLIFEIFHHKTIVHQWDYLNKKYLNENTYDFPIEKVKVFGNNIILLGIDNTISLIKIEDESLALQWSQFIPQELRNNIVFDKITPSVTKDHIILESQLHSKFGVKHFGGNMSHLATTISLNNGNVDSNFIKGKSLDLSSKPLNDKLLVSTYTNQGDYTTKSLIYDILKKKVVAFTNPILSISNDGSVYVTDNRNGSITIWRSTPTAE